jgi:diguanylate cyclase (GGDEF)-like protein
VLAELGARIQAAVRPADTVARFGGDEFVVICEQIDEPILMALGERLQEAIKQPLEINGVIHTTSASVGIAIGQKDPDTLLGNADVAVYRAKANGRARIELFH